MFPSLLRGSRLGCALATLVPGALIAQATVSGVLVVRERGDRPADDVAQAVVWLDARRTAAPAPVQVDVGTENKEFSPHVLVVPVGSVVAFPNHDPFNHNVFSRSEGNRFDLGLYGRGETRSTRFSKSGIVRIYCNVHAQMSAIVVVRDAPWFAQPTADGSFSIAGVPPGEYVLHAWHERASELTRPLVVPPGGDVAPLALELDARGYRHTTHLNKHGQPYPQQGRRRY